MVFAYFSYGPLMNYSLRSQTCPMAPPMNFPWFCYNPMIFMVFLRFAHGPLCVSYGFPKLALRISHGSPTLVLWPPYEFPMVFAYFSHRPLLNFPLFSYTLPMGPPCISCGVPVLVLWFPYGFLMDLLWFSYGFPMVFLWCS